MGEQRTLGILVTGQERVFWEMMDNLREMVIRPAEDLGWRVIVHVALDPGHRGNHHGHWDAEERARFEQKILTNLSNIDSIRWVGREHPFFLDCERTLQEHVDRGNLSPMWRDYLLYRSGSCLEYVQARVLLMDMEMPETGLILRTRTDVFLRHPICCDALLPLFSLRITTAIQIRDRYRALFPTSEQQLPDKAFYDPENRETSILVSQEENWRPSRWAWVLRKNLIYVMPYAEAVGVLANITSAFGSWDSREEGNDYWFNAESQFRGCLRRHHFQVLEFTPPEDQCIPPLERSMIPESRAPYFLIQR